MKTKLVKNVSDQTLIVMGIGSVKPLAEVVVPEDFNNGNFEEVDVDAGEVEKVESTIEEDEPKKITRKNNK